MQGQDLSRARENAENAGPEEKDAEGQDFSRNEKGRMQGQDLSRARENAEERMQGQKRRMQRDAEGQDFSRNGLDDLSRSTGFQIGTAADPQ